MKRRITLHLAVLALALTIGAGCATSRQAKDLIASSNEAIEELAEQRMAAADAEARALLADTDADLERSPEWPVGGVRPSSAPAPPAPAASQEEESQLWRTINGIDAFIAKHPDQPQLTNAMVARKAVLLAFAGKPNMAKAAFAAYQEDGGNARDRALYENCDTLVWWWTTSAVQPDSNTVAAVRNSLGTHIGALSAGIDRTPAGSEIRLYLAAIRAQMRWKLATLDEDGDPLPDLRVGLENYCATFTADQQRLYAVWVSEKFHLEPAIPAQGWRMIAQAESILEKYRERAPDGMDWGADCAWLTDPKDPESPR